MKVRFSPLVSEARGSAGPLVASGWKGIAYFRERVTPSNPNTVDQQAQRGRMTKVVAWWHDLEAQVKTDIATLAAGLAMSAYNLFTQRNVKDDYDVTGPRIMPLNASVLPLGNMTAAAGNNTKEITLTFTQGEAVTANKLYILAGETSGTGVIPAHLTLVEKETTAANAANKTITLAKASTWYFVAVLVENTTSSTFSVAKADYAQSHA